MCHRAARLSPVSFVPLSTHPRPQWRGLLRVTSAILFMFFFTVFPFEAFPRTPKGLTVKDVALARNLRWSVLATVVDYRLYALCWIAGNTQPNPTQPNPIQPNPTQPNPPQPRTGLVLQHPKPAEVSAAVQHQGPLDLQH